jgi:hypothetical protein
VAFAPVKYAFEEAFRTLKRTFADTTALERIALSIALASQRSTTRATRAWLSIPRSPFVKVTFSNLTVPVAPLVINTLRPVLAATPLFPLSVTLRKILVFADAPPITRFASTTSAGLPMPSKVKLS